MLGVSFIWPLGPPPSAVSPSTSYIHCGERPGSFLQVSVKCNKNESPEHALSVGTVSPKQGKKWFSEGVGGVMAKASHSFCVKNLNRYIRCICNIKMSLGTDE